jgi:hypothetical protein
MKLRRIELDDNELPSRATFDVTADEALYLAVLLGKMSGTQAEELLTGGGELSADLYECLTGSLFNRFYEDGVNDAVRARG